MLVRIEDVDQMVRHALGFLAAWLGSCNIHSSIEESGIDVHNLAIELKRQFNSNWSLAGRSCADNSNQLRFG